MTIVWGITVLAGLYFGGKTVLLKRQMQAIRKQIEFMRHNETQAQITLEKGDRSTAEFVLSLNGLIAKYREAGQQSERNEQLFKDTITNLSHDLRTPLATASGYMQLLTDQQLSGEQREFVSIASERIQAVKLLLDQLFELARIEANEWSVQNCSLDVNDVLGEVLAMFYPDFQKKAAIPSVELPDHNVSIWADETMLRRVFSNILYNAILHGEGDYRIVSTVNQGECEIRISNRTATIFPEDVAHLFERFYTTDQSRTKKSTGLGLTIARSLTVQMKGQIAASLDHGIFTIKLTFPVL